MPDLKISSKVDRGAWTELKAMAAESHQSIAGMLTEAIQEYLARRRVRPDVLRHLEDSMRDHDELGRRLAR